MRQRTLETPFAREGIGIHSGCPCRVVVRPAPVGTGRVFRRVDLDSGHPIQAIVENVISTEYTTVIGNGKYRVSTVEHLCAALHAAGVDNAFIDVEGPEVPVLDGSALPWLEAIQAVGLRYQDAERGCIVIREPIRIEDGNRRASILPASRLEIAVEVSFDHPMLGNRRFEVTLDDGAFGREVAWARTFGFLSEVERMHAAGLAQGASLTCALVFDEEGVRNPEGMRGPDEALRHKVLDLMGDLSLLGMPLRGRVELVRPGHGLHIALLRALRAHPETWSVVVG